MAKLHCYLSNTYIYLNLVGLPMYVGHIYRENMQRIIIRLNAFTIYVFEMNKKIICKNLAIPNTYFDWLMRVKTLVRDHVTANIAESALTKNATGELFSKETDGSMGICYRTWQVI